MQEDAFVCPICCEFFTDVVETQCCHLCFCKQCLDTWLQRNATCPSCREKISTAQCVPNIPLRRLVYELRRDCPNAGVGCTAIVTRGVPQIFQEHIQVCEYGKITCSNDQCGESFLRKDLGAHSSVCLFRQHACEYCATTIIYNQRKSHEEKCPMLPIPCPLEGCEEKVARKDMDEHHKQTCIYAEVACTYIKYGCQVKCLRKDLEAHKKDSTLAHFGLLETYTQKLETEKKQVEDHRDALKLEMTELKADVLRLSELKPGLPYHPWNTEAVILPHYLRDKTHQDSLSVKNNILKTQSASASIFSFGHYGTTNHHPAVVPANRTIPTLASSCPYPYYFEILVKNFSEDSHISIGLVDKWHDMKGEIGSSGVSWGYHLMENMIQASNKGRGTGMGRPYGKTVQINSFVGCGFDPANGTLFFTLNGQNLGIAFTGIPTTEGLYPAVCVQGESVELRANFGAEKFVYSYLEWGFFYEMLMKLGICLDKGMCSYYATGPEHVTQSFYHCKTCSFTGHLGVCHVCARSCHKGHELTVPVTTVCYCDCGDKCFQNKDNSCKSLNPALVGSKKLWEQ